MYFEKIVNGLVWYEIFHTVYLLYLVRMYLYFCMHQLGSTRTDTILYSFSLAQLLLVHVVMEIFGRPRKRPECLRSFKN